MAPVNQNNANIPSESPGNRKPLEKNQKKVALSYGANGGAANSNPAPQARPSAAPNPYAVPNSAITPPNGGNIDGGNQGGGQAGSIGPSPSPVNPLDKIHEDQQQFVRATMDELAHNVLGDINDGRDYEFQNMADDAFLPAPNFSVDYFK